MFGNRLDVLFRPSSPRSSPLPKTQTKTKTQPRRYDRAGDGTFAPPDLDQALRGLELRLSRSTLEAIAWRFRWQSRNHRAIRVDYEQMVEFVLASAPYEDEDEGGRRSGRDSHRSGESKSDDEYDDDRRGSGSGRGGSGRERDAGRSAPARSSGGGRRPGAEPEPAAQKGGRTGAKFVGEDGAEDLIGDVGDVRERRAAVLDVQDMHGFAALHVSSFRGHHAAARTLVQFGASRHLASTLGKKTALNLAPTRNVQRVVLTGLLESMEESAEKARRRLAGCRLVEKSAGGGSGGGGGSGVSRATQKVNQMVSLLAEGATDGVFESLDDMGMRAPLHFAAAAGSVTAATDLLARGEDCQPRDSNSWTPLHWCCLYGGERRRLIATALLDEGADANMPTLQGRTPLHVAAMAGFAHPEVDKKPSGASSSSEAEDEDSAMITLLVHKGADLEATDHEGCTPLLRAAQCGRVHCAAVLLAAGARYDARNAAGWTALHLAAKQGHADAIRLLSQWDAERGLLRSTRNCKGHTPYAVASMDNDPRRVQASQAAMRTVWEAAAEGDLQMLQQTLAAGGGGSARGGDANSRRTRYLWEPAG